MYWVSGSFVKLCTLTNILDVVEEKSFCLKLDIYFSICLQFATKDQHIIAPVKIMKIGARNFVLFFGRKKSFTPVHA